jgi:ubiquinone/menaquinone biosynthesis C-methylase UbiE
MTRPEPRPRICDYEGSNYRTEFWENQGRDYEDRVERIALRRLLNSKGKRLLEVGAGFGRLTNEYQMYEKVVLLDYSLSQLQYAQEHLGQQDRYIFVAADAYKLPFRPGVFDGVTMIRVIHHMASVRTVLAQLRRALVPGGMFILEHANKRNIKSVMRFSMKKQDWNPHDLHPVEFVELNYDFHPEYIRQELQAAGFSIERRIPVSFFRLEPVKKTVNTSLLASMDGMLQSTGLLYAPSVFVKSTTLGSGANNLSMSSIFACPECGGDLTYGDEEVICQREGLRWAIRDGIYDFKAPLDDN